MKTTQAWGWLAAGVLALGLNGSYLDGGAQWAHRVVERVTDRASAVLAQATGRADWLRTEVRVLTARDEAASLRRVSLVQGGDCPVGAAMARVQAGVARSEAEYGRVEAMSAREEARLARREANRARVETARMETQIAAQAARIRVANFAFDSVVFNPAKASACGRVRVNIPRVPKVKIAAPAIPTVHIETPGTGPV
ncbi:hypothetical protein SBA1_10001 [Candidatus Sulfotelmatobacter kueseliae]|uniref:Uncharacterized protein n=1 Tax=Candidatus Sulfotelmatobacter kueseliae TaxID=2042962 RepID=A0A2U3JV49_9BACT|nr:hypothetical protein SBA1_10001 [Candidatus Sulfotelmatobacter kueseliae]